MIKNLKTTGIIAISLMIVMISACSTEQEGTKINIHDKTLNEVNDYLFGHFLEKASWGGEIGGDMAINPETGEIVPEVLRLMKTMNIPIIRYPGGGDVDYYPWYNLIDNVPGHHEQRPDYYTRDGKKKVSDHRMGLDEFLDLCEKIDADPQLVVNLGDPFLYNISIEEAARNAAGMVVYCNGTKDRDYGDLPVDWVKVREQNGREKPYNVKYFEVGNEPWLFTDGLPMKEGVDSLIIHYLDCLEAIVNAMKAVDPDIKIITDGGIKEVSAKMKQRLGDDIDYLAYHPYLPWEIDTVFKDDKPVAIDSLTAEDIWNTWVITPTIDTVTGMTKFVDDDYYRHAFSTDYPVAVTEWNWNGWFSGDLKKDAALNARYAKGVGAAGFIHALMRMGDRIDIANQSLLVGRAWDITGIRVFPDFDIKPVLFPTGHITGFYSNYHGNSLLDYDVEQMEYYQQPYRMGAIKPAEKVAYLDICVTGSDNKIFVHVINRCFDHDKSVNIDLSEFNPAGQAQHRIVKGKIGENLLDDNPDSLSYEVHHSIPIDDPLQVTLPERSVSCIEIPIKK